MTKAQKQKKLKELSELIMVRNHVMSLVNGPRGLVSKEDVKKLQNFVTQSDKEVVQTVVALDAEPVVHQPSKKDKEMAEARAKMNEEKPAPKQEAKKEPAKDTKTEKTEKPKKQSRKGMVNRVLD